MNNHIEKTFILFKPHAVQRGIVGEVLARFEKVGLKIVGAKMIMPTYDQYYHHYETIGTMVSRHGKEIFDMTLEMMQDAPVMAFVLEGIEAVALVRKMTGATEPKSALPGTIRGDYAHMSYGHSDDNKFGLHNIIHASGNQEEAKQEIAHWFSESELFSYESVHDMSAQKIRKNK
jgi:nucleoside-diphosphate kinase